MSQANETVIEAALPYDERDGAPNRADHAPAGSPGPRVVPLTPVLPVDVEDGPVPALDVTRAIRERSDNIQVAAVDIRTGRRVALTSDLAGLFDEVMPITEDVTRLVDAADRDLLISAWGWAKRLGVRETAPIRTAWGSTATVVITKLIEWGVFVFCFIPVEGESDEPDTTLKPVPTTSASLLLTHEGIIEGASGSLPQIADFGQAKLIGSPLRDLVHVSDQRSFDTVWQLMLHDATSETQSTSLRLRSSDGRTVTCQLTLADRSGLRSGLGVTADLVVVDEPHGLLPDDFRILAETLPLGVFVMTPLGHIEFANETIDRLFGGRSEAYNWLEAIHPDDQLTVFEAIDNLRFNRRVEIEVRFLNLDGEYRICRVIARDRRKPSGELVSIAGLVEDISDIRAVQLQLERQANHDALTGLWNRARLFEYLNQILSLASPSSGLTAVLFIDLDGFKLINDTQGHAVGDQLLRTVSLRFNSALGADDRIARFGGDEFVVVCRDLANLDEAIAVANRLHRTLEDPISLSGQQITCRASIGLSLAASGFVNPDQLVGDADLAMYEAKRGERSRTIVYDESLRRAAAHRFDLTSDLHRARDRCELRLEYQPILDLRTMRPVAAEALIRWQHPTLGQLMPSDFIEFAEQRGLINELGDWVVQQACRDLAELRRMESVDDDFWISVNVSTMQLTALNDLISTAEVATATQGLRSNHLLFELTESIPVDTIPESAERIRQLISHGYRLAIDDFGTAHSGLEYITMLPFDVLKVDPAFTGRLTNTIAVQAVLESMMLLARKLNFRIVAEGIESTEQLHMLTTAGVHFGQGYMFARPAPIQRLARHLRALTKSADQQLSS